MSRLYAWFASIDIVQILRYYTTGAVINAIGYLLFLLLLSGGVGHKVAASLLYLVGAAISFYVNRKLIFESSVSLRASLWRLVLMLLAGYLLNIAILYLCVDRAGVGAGIVQLFSIVFVSVFFYIVNKFFVHRNQDL